MTDAIKKEFDALKREVKNLTSRGYDPTFLAVAAPTLGKLLSFVVRVLNEQSKKIADSEEHSALQTLADDLKNQMGQLFAIRTDKIDHLKNLVKIYPSDADATLKQKILNDMADSIKNALTASIPELNSTNNTPTISGSPLTLVGNGFNSSSPGNTLAPSASVLPSKIQ